MEGMAQASEGCREEGGMEGPGKVGLRMGPRLCDQTCTRSHRPPSAAPPRRGSRVLSELRLR